MEPGYIKIDIVDENCDTVLSSLNFSFEDNRIILHGKKFPLLDRGTEVKAIGHRRDGIVVLEGTVTLSIEKQLNIHITEYGEMCDRREYLKVRTDVKAIIKESYMGKSRRGLIVDRSVQLRDISIGGLCFFADQVFFPNQRLYIWMHELHKDLVVKAVVLRRKRENPRLGFRYRYACKFVGLNNFGQTIICEHVFRKELENYYEEQEKEAKISD